MGVAQIKQGGNAANRRSWSMFPLARAPFWYRFFEPQPNDSLFIQYRLIKKEKKKAVERPEGEGE